MKNNPEEPENSNIFRGIPASPGISIGRAFLYTEDNELNAVRRSIPKSRARHELARYSAALAQVRAELNRMKDKVLQALGKEHARLIDTHIMIVEDPLIIKDVPQFVLKEQVNVEYALSRIIEEAAKAFDQVEDEYFRDRKNDLLDVGKKIMQCLLQKERAPLSNLEHEVIVIAHNLMPTDTLHMREEKVIGFATDMGGRTSHTALLAQSLEIPAVVGLHDIVRHVHDGDLIIVDGNEGVIVVAPDEHQLESYKRAQQLQISEGKALEHLRDLPAVTRDGRRVELAANIDSPSELGSVLKHGAEGIGLYRTEYLYLNRTDFPTEKEHYENYKIVGKSMLPHPVIIRTVDIGGDKLRPLGLGKQDTTESNPFLGLRGIRLCLQYPDFFKVQLRAILRASVEGKFKIMYPMISGVEELRAANKILEDVKNELQKEGLRYDEEMEVGVMIEVPAAALITDILAQEADFVSLGTNDLIQYTLAVDRGNENVANLYEPTHLSVLRLLRHVIDSAHKAGKWVGMCGEMATDPEYTTLLLGLGLDEFSVAAGAVPKIKNLIRSASYLEAKELASSVLRSSDRSAVRKALKRTKTS